jgi:hypothetical protein
VQLYKLRVWSCAVGEMCMCVFRFNKDVLWIVGVLWDHLGELWRYSVLCMRLLHVKIVFANLLLYNVESVIKSVVL